VFFVKSTVIASSWPHLGNTVSRHQNESACIAMCHDQLIGQLNEELCACGKLSYTFKIDKQIF
jgi:hypothetical protein